MRKSKFSEVQIAAVLKEAEAEAGVAVAEVAREHGISSATFYQWRSKYGGMEVSAPRAASSAASVPAWRPPRERLA